MLGGGSPHSFMAPYITSSNSYIFFKLKSSRYKFNRNLILLTEYTVNQLLKFVDIANFLRRFDSSTNAPLSNFDTCLRASHFMTKAFTLTVIIPDLRKKPIFVQKPKFCTFRENLRIQSHSTDGKRSNSKPNTIVKLDIIN